MYEKEGHKITLVFIFYDFLGDILDKKDTFLSFKGLLTTVWLTANIFLIFLSFFGSKIYNHLKY